jgi:glutamine synthetase type III
MSFSYHPSLRHVYSLSRSIDASAHAQEFFVTSHSNYLGRPDLLHTGRTLLGALPARAQQVK